MKTVPVREARAKFSEYLDEAGMTHEIVRIERTGKPTVVMMAEDELDSLQETLFWLSQSGIREDIAQARKEVAEGTTISGNELRARYGLPPLS